MAEQSVARAQRPSKWRFAAYYVLPTLLILVAVLWPLVSGSHTLFFRDVFNTHLEMKWWQAEAMADGYLPLVDPYRSGGQPHTGNPNTVPLYPDNLLYRVAPFFWAFNAHFWLHLLLAPFSVFWLGRSLGLERRGAWAAGVFYGASGYFLSQLNLYNLVAPAALAPAFLAGVVNLGKRPSERRFVVATGVLWGLLVLAGDPMTAVMALGMAASLLWTAPVSRRSLVRLTAGLGAGTLLAAPQWVEFFRVVGLSFRGHWGYSAAGATVASWHPATVLEWLIPFAYGRPDLAFWGHRFYSDTQPLFYSFYPGVLALICLAVGASWKRPAARWALVLIGCGLFLALGGHNPIVAWLLTLPFVDVLRLPVKFWPLVAVPSAVLAGLGFDRCLAEAGFRRLRLMSFGLFALLAGAWLVVVMSGQRLDALLAGWMPPSFADSGLATAERVRWAGLLMRSAGLAALFWAVTWVRPQLFRRLAPTLLVLHLGVQLAFLAPLVRTEPVALYAAAPEATVAIPEGSLALHGAAGGSFGREPIPAAEYPGPDPRWLQRQVHNESYPYVGMMNRRRFEFALSPEGLDSFLTRAATEALPLLSDRARLQLLRASGVEWLYMKRPLGSELGVELEGRFRSLGGDLLLYRILDTAPSAGFVSRFVYSETLNDALGTLTSPRFRADEEVVLAGVGEPGSGAAGSARPIEAAEEVEAWSWRVMAEESGVLLIQKTYLPIYQVTVNGIETSPVVANMHRIAVPVDAGEHIVTLRVDRRWLRGSFALSLLTATGLLLYLLGLPGGRWPRTRPL